MFDDQRDRLLNALDKAHDAYQKAAPFSGPSLHFHLKALEAARAQELDRFAEYAYATLASWGMHRMGPGGSKMCEFDEFYSSLRNVWHVALSLQTRTPDRIGDGDWEKLKSVFCGVHCMASATSLIGNSKVMAHLIPSLVPPVDREYTLTLLYGHGRITNDKEREWAMFKEILEGFFYPVVRSPLFQSKAAKWLAESNRRNWDSSELKIVDNLIIGLRRIPPGEQAAAPTGGPAVVPVR
jgi:hypothetical protein